MAVNDIYKLRIISTLGAQTAFNVRTYKVTAQVGAGISDQTVVTALSADIAPLYKALMSNQASYRGCGYQKIWPLPVGLERFGTSGQGAGTVTGDPLPKQVAGLISFYGPLANKHNRGRIYISFPAEVDNDSTMKPTMDYLTRLLALAVYLGTDKTVAAGPDSVTIRPVIYDRVAHTSQDILQTFARSLWATQRRRGDFGKANLSPI